jgi:hypothetical protein
MGAYRIECFGSVEGIALQSSEDPRPGPKEIMTVAFQVRDRRYWSWLYGTRAEQSHGHGFCLEPR